MFKKHQTLIISSLILGLLFTSLLSWYIFSFAIENAKLKPLVADENHEVVVFEECDLAIKFSKVFQPKLPLAKKGVLVFVFPVNVDGQTLNEQVFSISCTKDSLTYKPKYNGSFVASSLKSVLKNKEYYQVGAMLGGGSGSCSGLAYYFEHKEMFYVVQDRVSPADFSCAAGEYMNAPVDKRSEYFWKTLQGRYGSENTIYLQFNSLAPSKPSITEFENILT